MAIKIGIGSWADKEYTGVLYPKGVKPKERLPLYATHFNHVEVNSTSYGLPKEGVVREWIEQTPAEFTFDIKLPKNFQFRPQQTANDADTMRHIHETFAPLAQAEKLRTFFLLLTADFSPDKRKLEELVTVSEKLRPCALAVELRHNGWIEGAQRERTLDFFRAHQLTWIAVDMPQIKGSTLMPAVDEVTNPALAYLRLHGRNPGYLDAATTEEGHTYAYNESELKEIAARAQSLAAKAKEVHVIANNHAQDFAPRTALALQALLGVNVEGRKASQDELF
jgi:uncharacterized protein YecE (DUF72 family)